MPDGPRIAGVLEACLYAEDLTAGERFYTTVIGLQAFAREAGRHVFFRAGDGQVFLLFDPRRTREQSGALPVPPHGASGAGHVAFAIRAADLDAWRARLATLDVAIESEVAWPRGGHSLYMRDPAGNSVELATRSLWGFAEAGE